MMQHPGTYDHKCGVYFFLKLLYQYRCIRYCQETPIQSMQVSVYQLLIDSLTPKIMIDKFLYSQNNLVSDSVTIQFLFVFGPCSPCSCSCSYSEFCSYDSSCCSFVYVIPVSCLGSVSCSTYYYVFSGIFFLFQFFYRFFFYFYFQLLLCIILILVIFLFLVLIPYLVLVLVLILVFIRILVLILIIVLVLF